MRLDEYLKKTTQDEFAKAAGVSQGLISQWLSGTTSITAENAVKIERITKGAVTRQELRPDIFNEIAA
jgi:DNA-binding transcriptional regulator YdaS (Cro superfamily)